MSHDNLFFLILGMTAVTYIPRLLPFFIIRNQKLSDRLETFLNYIPYTALGALIFPGVFSATPSFPPAAICGLGFAIFCSWKKDNLILTVLGSIVVCFLVIFGHQIMV
ncbi:MAG: AzlD domain-containing protein [Tissierellales bacterium]|jgi:branched-subunit amino acid transport protein|nr:AzlD domain-containing protein [Tissierellales bacterium]